MTYATRDSQARSRGAIRRSTLFLAGLPVLFTVFYLAYGSQQFHWDTLERAYLVEHPTRYLRTWDGSPRSQFLSFAHVLELPMAWLLGQVVSEESGLEMLRNFEALMAGVTLGLLGALAVLWGTTTTAAVWGQATLGVSFAFWKMGSSGEERVVALATQLFFLFLFWRALQSGRGSRWIGAALVLAILTHLSAALLVPFAMLALVWVPAPWKQHRLHILRSLVVGGVVAALVYFGVAAWTTQVRSLSGFIDYLGFFHQTGGNNFFELFGSPSAPQSGELRIVRVARGLTGFFAAWGWIGAGVAVAFTTMIAARWMSERRTSHGRTEAVSSPGRKTFLVHTLVLGVLWTLHFVFYEPQNHESWTLVVALAILVTSSALPKGRALAGTFVLPLALLAANVRSFASHHERPPIDESVRLVDKVTRPNDIVVLTGGIQNEKPVQGSIHMRYFLAYERQRLVVSLYDIMGLTQPEYWGKPIASPEQLMSALRAGRRAYFPGFLKEDFERMNKSGLVHITYEARGDDLFEITSIAATTSTIPGQTQQ